jgi:SAM-dependent methyltransferase
MDVRDIVKGHYGGADLADAILRALAGAGVDTSALGVRDLTAVDELHAGSVQATEHLLGRLELDAGSRLLDIGCGIGGPARVAASAYGCRTTGVDLTPEFVSTAAALTDRVGLQELVDFTVASGDELPFPDASFDRAMMIHVGMNVPDKGAVFTEVRRVLEPGGRFGIFEQMRCGEGELPYPMPWAEDDRSSFVASPEEYGALLEGAGFKVVLAEDRTAAVAGPPQTGPGGLTPQAVFGPVFAERIGNNIAATKAGLLGAVLIVARAL